MPGMKDAPSGESTTAAESGEPDSRTAQPNRPLPTLDPLSVDGALLAPPEQVLSTLNQDGSRRWMRPRLSRGRYLTARRGVAYGLIALFTLIPHIHIGGKPLMLLHVAKREFTFFGATFLPTDTVLLALFMVCVLVGIFLITALLGRVWCGWACPQTVYMEFLFRPLERLFEGTSGRGGTTGGKRTFPRTMLLYLSYLLASLFLAHTFLAYFVPVSELLTWMTRSPLEHPGSFGVMAVTTGLMMFNFCYFREQTCLLACPYGRFQSVLLDRDSLIISYDEARGEPRGKLRVKSAELRVKTGGNGAPESRQRGLSPDELADHHSELATRSRGDCVDCHLCVITCPTGIDIRQGLQMECVACAQCIDACDAVMDKIGRPRGLIRYTSETRLAGGAKRTLRPRVIAYSAVILLLGGILTTLLATWPTASVQVLRGVGLPYKVSDDGAVSNELRIRITNRTEAAAEYEVALEDVPGAVLTVDPHPVRVAPGETVTATAHITRPASAAAAPVVDCRFHVRDGRKFDKLTGYRLLGPPVSRGVKNESP